MVCNFPVTIKSEQFPQGIQVPCGHCIACRIQHSKEWAMRILHELPYWDSAVFITLTYDDDHLPEDSSLHKETLQDFFKHLRKKLTINDHGKIDYTARTIKYYACGEYGEKYNRPHYHAIVFGLSKDDSELIKKCWPYGFIKVGTVTYDSARYVADYVDKKYNGEKAHEKYAGKQIPFQLQSQGIGRRYALENAGKLRSDLSIKFRGTTQGINRYYKKILDIDREDSFRSGEQSRFERNVRIMEKYDLTLTKETEWYKNKSREQKDKEIKARCELFSKSKL